MSHVKQIIAALFFTVWAATAAAYEPNILVVMVDDLDIPMLEVLLERDLMPHLKRGVIDRGVTFNNSFVSNSLCCPSRATFLTGQYTHNHGALSNYKVETPTLGFIPNIHGGLKYWWENGHPVEEKNTLATWMSDAGYRTAHVGKYLTGIGMFTGKTYIPAGWSWWEGLIDPTAFRMYFNQFNLNGRVVTSGGRVSNYQTDVLAVKAARFIDEHLERSPEQPFFLAVNPVAPHVESNVAHSIFAFLQIYRSFFWASITPAPRHLGVLRRVIPTLPRTPAFNERSVRDKPRWIRKLSRLSRGLFFNDVAAAIRQFKTRAASMLAVDDLIGELVDVLEGHDQLDNTVIIFTADNGWMYGEHRLSGKIYAYEESIRVPLIIAAPDGPRGTSSDAMVINNDLAPTIADYANATPQRPMDGRSLRPLLEAEQSWLRKHVFIEHWEVGVSFDHDPPSFLAVRSIEDDRDELYVEWYKTGGFTERIFFEYYDLRGDPAELSNAYHDLPLTRKMSLRMLIDQFRVCRGESNSCSDVEDLNWR